VWLEQRLKSLNDQLLQQEINLEEAIIKYGRQSEQHLKIQEGIDGTKQSIKDLHEAERARFEQISDFEGALESMDSKYGESYKNLKKITDDYYDGQDVQFKKVEKSVMKEMTVRQQLAHWYKSNQEEETKLAVLNGKSVIRNEIMEGTAGLISSILKSVPYPFNIALAATSGIAVQRIVDKNLASFEDGGMVGGRRHSQGGTIIEAEQGEFVMSRDAVSRIGVNNLEAMNSGGGGMTINISAPLVDDTVVDSIIPKIKEAVRRGESLT
jgi:hypothetical protein